MTLHHSDQTASNQAQAAEKGPIKVFAFDPIRPSREAAPGHNRLLNSKKEARSLSLINRQYSGEGFDSHLGLGTILTIR